jgi:hypothetical protein
MFLVVLLLISMGLSDIVVIVSEEGLCVVVHLVVVLFGGLLVSTCHVSC